MRRFTGHGRMLLARMGAYELEDVASARHDATDEVGGRRRLGHGSGKDRDGVHVWGTAAGTKLGKILRRHTSLHLSQVRNAFRLNDRIERARGESYSSSKAKS